ncbi:MAG: NADPH-dependent dioxygenase [Lentimonas sp.]|jgi:NADPH-dependent dioxygenase
MLNIEKNDITILGAGPVGLIAAHALSDRGIEYALLESSPKSHSHSYALALHPETLNLLESLGLADEILKVARRIKSIAIYSGNHRKATLDYSHLKTKYPFLSVIGQAELESILIHSLQRKGKHVNWLHRVRYIEPQANPLKITVTRCIESITSNYAMGHPGIPLNQLIEYNSQYLIGADGLQSIARQSAGINFNQIAPPKNYAFFDCKSPSEYPDEMCLVLNNGQTHMFWPMSHGLCRWSFELDEGKFPFESKNIDPSAPEKTTPRFPQLNQDHLEALIKEHAPWFCGTIDSIPWRMIVKFERRLAACFGSDRIWLAGDAAHACPPAGVLSMNIGMREAYDLAQRLASGPSDQARAAALSTYNQARKHVWTQLLNLQNEYNDSDCSDPWLRENKKLLIGNIPATGETLSALLAQIEMNIAA